MKRCTKCILPENHPGIVFNEEGIRNQRLQEEGVIPEEVIKKIFHKFGLDYSNLEIALSKALEKSLVKNLSLGGESVTRADLEEVD